MKDNKYPGPAHGYKVDAKKGFIGVHKVNTSPPRSNKPEIDDSFQHYYVKTNQMSPRFSFGINVGSQMLSSTNRTLPKHLRKESSSPGPGQYESKSSISMTHRAPNSQ
jgi:hypothetical protein